MRREPIGRTLGSMAEGWGNAVAWSAGVSGAGAALAAIFSGGKGKWQHILFAAFLVIAIAAFVVLLAAGLRWLSGRSKTRSQRPEDAMRPAKPDIWFQRNVAHGHGRAFGVQDGNLIVHQNGPAEPPEKKADGARD